MGKVLAFIFPCPFVQGLKILFDQNRYSVAGYMADPNLISCRPCHGLLHGQVDFQGVLFKFNAYVTAGLYGP